MGRMVAAFPLLWVGMAWLGPTLARAADMEVRDFTIWVDGKRGGEYHMTITRQDDGSASMSAQADVKLSFAWGLKTYTYTYRGTEVWKDERLVSLSSTSNDDGKQFAVTAVAEANGIRVKANGQERMARSDVWLTTYWHLPTAAQRIGAVPLIDADTGRDISGTMQYVGPAQLNVGGQVQNVSHFRLTGGMPTDLWYDASERLVREEWIEDGHKSLLELARIRR